MKEIHTAGTLIEYEGRILTLLRNKEDDGYPNTWGLAAGRIEENEEPLLAAVREIKEETGLIIEKEQLEDLGMDTWHLPTVIVHFYPYRLVLQKPITVTINPNEHKDYDWKTPQEILELDNAIPGLKDLIETHYSQKNN